MNTWKLARVFKRPVNNYLEHVENDVERLKKRIQKNYENYGITEAFLTPNKWSRPCTKLESVRGIVLHWVGAVGQSDTAVARYFERLGETGNRYASAHFIIDENSTTQVIPENEMAYHVGAEDYYAPELGPYPNDCTIGIELCHVKWKGPGVFHRNTIYKAQLLCKYLLSKYNLTTADVYRHYDVTRKICPAPWVETPEEWERFKNNIWSA